AACYELFAIAGLVYGPTMQALTLVQTGRDAQGQAQVLGRLQMPSAGGNAEDFALNLSVMDGALQATAALMLDEASGKAALPFALENLEVFSSVPAQAWVWARLSAGSRAEDAVRKLDVDVLNDDGLV